MHTRITFCATILCLLGTAHSSQECKCSPSDACWPSDAEFESLNTTLNGRLIRGIPPGSVSYQDQPNFDPIACETVRNEWHDASFHGDYSISIGFPYWADNPCPPIFENGTSVNGDRQAGSKGCSIGKYPAYAVNASNTQDIQAAFAFANARDIRVNVKSTGLSLVGRSTAFGSLSIWTHYLRGIEFDSGFQPENCESVEPQTALTLAAGETVGALYAAADSHDIIVVGGLSTNVGVVGWLLGGGHGPLSGTYGMGVDNALQFKIVTPSGEALVANQCQNSDLFWALRGGGGGTFGVVTSVTMKAYPNPTIAVHDIAVTAMSSTSDSSYWNFVAELHSYLAPLRDGGMQGYLIMTPAAFSPSQSNTLTWSFALYNKPNGTIETLINPVLNFLNQNNNTLITYTSRISNPPSFYTNWKSRLGPEPVATSGVSIGSRLLPASIFSPQNTSTFAQTLQNITTPGPNAAGPPILQTEMIANSANRNLNISLVPAWRDALVHFVVSEGFPDSASQATAEVFYQRQTARVAQLKALAPESGAYLNEADPFDPDWQVDFWGVNYDGVRRVKERVDPGSSLWCVSCAGGEGWGSLGNGRLCKRGY